MKTHLKTHSKQVQSNIGFGSFERSPKDITCDKCDLMFANNFSLKRHMQTFHKVDSSSSSSSVSSKNINKKNNYSCTKCPLRFASNYSVKRHMHTIHKVTSDNDNRIIHYKDHFMTRVNENTENKFEIKEDKSVTVPMSQDKSDLCENMNSFLKDVISKAVNIAEEEKKKMCKSVLLDILEEQFKPIVILS